MTNQEWLIAMTYTIATALESLFIAGIATSDFPEGFLVLTVILGATILFSLSEKGSDDVQEY